MVFLNFYPMADSDPGNDQPGSGFLCSGWVRIHGRTCGAYKTISIPS